MLKERIPWTETSSDRKWIRSVQQTHCEPPVPAPHRCPPRGGSEGGRQLLATEFPLRCARSSDTAPWHMNRRPWSVNMALTGAREPNSFWRLAFLRGPWTREVSRIERDSRVRLDSGRKRSRLLPARPRTSPRSRQSWRPYLPGPPPVVPARNPGAPSDPAGSASPAAGTARTLRGPHPVPAAPQ